MLGVPGLASMDEIFIKQKPAQATKDGVQTIEIVNQQGEIIPYLVYTLKAKAQTTALSI